MISRVTKEPNDFPVQQNLISNNNPFILPTLPLWSTIDWFPSVRRSLHWTPHHSEGGSSVVTSSFFLSRASWSKFYVLVYFLCFGVTFFALERFYYLEWYYSDMRSRDGWRHHFMVVTWILVWFFSVLDEIFVLVRFCLSWCHFIPWCDQPNLGMIFLRFGYNFRFSEIIFLLVLFHILVRSTASWYDFPSFCYALSSKCDFVWFGVILYLGAINCILVWSLCFGYWYFLYISFLFLH